MSQECCGKSGDIRRIAQHLREQATDSTLDACARRMLEVALELDRQASIIESGKSALS